MARSPVDQAFFIYFTIFSYFLSTIHAEPVQYCKFGYDANGDNAEADFCMGVTMHQNQSSNTHDMYLTMTVTQGSDLGWTAIGTGPMMTGSLMMVVYGDPRSEEPPTVSIRTTVGHRNPDLITEEDTGGADIRLLQSSWQPVQDDSSSSTFLAKVSLVCYSCHLWPGSNKGSSLLSATETSLPWIWAWNNDQKFPAFSRDAHLDMHNGGYGTFYVDMSRSINNAKSLPPLPVIQPGVRTLGTSDTPIDMTKTSKLFNPKTLAYTHAFVMGLAFLCLFPLGVLTMRSQSSKAFKYHWVIQLMASLCVGFGAVLGLVMSRGSIGSPHKATGIVVTVALSIQGILGWRHHMVFLQIRRRTWISHAHIWTGRVVMVVGWANVISGLLMKGFSQAWIVLVSGLVVGEVAGLTFWVWACNRRKLRESRLGATDSAMPLRADEEGEYFVLDDDEEDAKLSEMGDHDRDGSSPYDPMIRKHGSD
ncbi:hypothetical protein BBP40_005945 [Aspergillus hancockii]|nr:hypothetical protein BBP40_005945 [Aspergillus hancockii]